MLAATAAELPTGEFAYEPKYDGFRCIVFRDGGEVLLSSRNQKPLNRYFPELEAVLAEQLPDRIVVDGEIVIPSPEGLDFDLLTQRIHPAESRVKKLSEETPAVFVIFDLLAFEDFDVRGESFATRRDLLEKAVANCHYPVVLTRVTNQFDVATEWFSQFEGAGLDGVIAKPLDSSYESGVRGWIKVKHERTADCVVAGYRLHKDGKGVGSLLLGLYDDQGSLQHVGVASGLSAAERKEMLQKIKPLQMKNFAEHPWADWGQELESAVRMPGAPHRWNSQKDMSWFPIRPERVVEVRYTQLQAGYRFRHNAHFLRWRPDREPKSCTFSQLEVVAPAELAALLNQ